MRILTYLIIRYVQIFPSVTFIQQFCQALCRSQGKQIKTGNPLVRQFRYQHHTGERIAAQLEEIIFNSHHVTVKVQNFCKHITDIPLIVIARWYVSAIPPQRLNVRQHFTVNFAINGLRHNCQTFYRHRNHVFRQMLPHKGQDFFYSRFLFIRSREIACQIIGPAGRTKYFYRTRGNLRIFAHYLFNLVQLYPKAP